VEISSCTVEQVDYHNACQEHPVNTGSHTLDIELSIRQSVQGRSHNIMMDMWFKNSASRVSYMTLK